MTVQPVRWSVPGPAHVPVLRSCPPLWSGIAASGFPAQTDSQIGMNSEDTLLAPYL